MEKFISNHDLGSLNVFLDKTIPSKTTTESPRYHLWRNCSGRSVLRNFAQGVAWEAVGHWVLLTKLDEYRYEYFDCLGDPVPDEVTALSWNRENVLLETTSRKLMDPKGTICGKWVMFRLLCFPTTCRLSSSLSTLSWKTG
jgi:hypothetical protein